MRRRPRPGVTAAPTTAALATGEGPGLTAAPTTAAFATGAGPGLATAVVTTAALATRDALSGMSGSFCFEGFVGLEGRDDGLGGDPSIGHELATGATDG